MLFERFNKYPDIIPPIDKKKIIALSKKLLPDTIFNMASLEGNPFTRVISMGSTKSILL